MELVDMAHYLVCASSAGNPTVRRRGSFSYTIFVTKTIFRLLYIKTRHIVTFFVDTLMINIYVVHYFHIHPSSTR